MKSQAVTQGSIENEEVSIRQVVNIPIRDGNLIGEFFTFHNLTDSEEHIAIGLGPWRENSVPLVRIHSECLTGDIFGSRKCDCGPQLDEAIDLIAEEGGIILYLRQEGRGIGLYNKMDAYHLQSLGFDTFKANEMLNFPDDLRSFRSAAEMLQALGLESIQLLSNNPDKKEQLMDWGIDVKTDRATSSFVCEQNRPYLEAKVSHANHKIKI